MRNFIGSKLLTEAFIYKDGKRAEVLLNSFRLSSMQTLEYGRMPEDEAIVAIKDFDENKKNYLAILFNGLLEDNLSDSAKNEIFSVAVKGGINVVNPKNINSTIDLTEINFKSRQHFRYENGKPNFDNDTNVERHICIQKIQNNSYLVSVEDNNRKIVLAPKKMKIVFSDKVSTTLRGAGYDDFGFPFCGYGFTIHHASEINRVFSHWYDRNITIEYLK